MPRQFLQSCTVLEVKITLVLIETDTELTVEVIQSSFCCCLDLSFILKLLVKGYYLVFQSDCFAGSLSFEIWAFLKCIILHDII